MRSSTKSRSEGRTVRLVEQRRVARPIREVFEYSSDFSNIQDWDPGVARSIKTSDGVVGLGTSYELDLRFGWRSLPMTYEIAEYEPWNRVVLVGRGEKIEAVDEIRFGIADNMTVIDYKADLTFHNFVRYLGPLLNRALRRVGERALDGLVLALDG